jgi:PTS system fructose-specific IIA component
MSVEYTSEDLVVLSTSSESKDEVIRELGLRFVNSGTVTDLDGYVEAVREREEHFPSGIEGGIAIPHAHTELVTSPGVAVAISKQGIYFGADDGPAHLIFLIAAPLSADNLHLEILGKLARHLTQQDFRDQLLAANSSSAVAALVNGALGDVTH